MSPDLSNSDKLPKAAGWRDKALAKAGLGVGLTIERDGSVVGTVRVHPGYVSQGYLHDNRVFEARLKGQACVIKCISGIKGVPESGKEAKILLNLKHKHIVEVIGIVYCREFTFLATKRVANGSLSNVLASTNKALRTQEMLHRYTLQILDALVYLHGPGNTVHGDLKTDNVLIDESLNVKVCDFGLSTTVAEPMGPDVVKTSALIRSSGNWRFLAIEHLIRRVGLPSASTPLVDEEDLLKELPRKSAESDMWSFGNLMLHMFSGTLPWSTLNTLRQEQDLLPEFIWGGGRPSLPEHAITGDVYLSMAYWRYCHDCWEHIPRRRPTASQLRARLQVPALQVLPAHDPTLDALRDLVESEVEDVSHQFPEQVYPYEDGAHNSAIFRGAWCPPEALGGRVLCYLKRYDGSPPMRSGWSERLLREMIIWRCIRHENVMKLVGRCKKAEIWHAVYECDYVPFLEYMEEYDRWQLPDAAAKHLFVFQMLFDVSRALVCMHSQRPPLAHNSVNIGSVYVDKRRIQSENGLKRTVQKEETLHACIANFADTRIVTPDQLHVDVNAFGTLMRHALSRRIDLADSNSGIGALRILIEECERSRPGSTEINMRNAQTRVGALLKMHKKGIF